MKTLHWKKGAFKSTYKIYSNDTLVGTLKENVWKQSADGELTGKKYNFKTKGFFKQETEIVHADTNTALGKITYNSWMTKATIELSDRKIFWKYDNVWNTKWSLFDSEGIQIQYQGSSFNGKIEFNSQDDLLVLTGLFITNYYWQIAIAVFVAVFIPVWTSALH